MRLRECRVLDKEKGWRLAGGTYQRRTRNGLEGYGPNASLEQSIYPVSRLCEVKVVKEIVIQATF